MKVLLISYGDFDYDGRLRELYKIAQKIGCVYLISRGKSKIDSNHYLVNVPYMSFIKRTIFIGKQIEDVDILFLDNRKAILPGLKLKKYYKKAKVVLDCRELYLFKYVKHIIGKIGCLIEKKGIKKANVIICANRERAAFMKDYYKLDDLPLVFENIRKLEYTAPEAEFECKRRFDRSGSRDIRIVSTAGCDVSRLTDILVRDFSKISCDAQLFLVGGGKPKDIALIKKICEENNIRNVNILGKLNQDELKAIIGSCDIGIVSYHQRDLNNYYCASGKVYEYLFEGIPIVTTTNPPLVNFCKKYGVGVSGDSFFESLKQVLENYDDLKNKVRLFIDENKIKPNYLVVFADKLSKRLN